jgi:hypothetical protein
MDPTVRIELSVLEPTAADRELRETDERHGPAPFTDSVPEP